MELASLFDTASKDMDELLTCEICIERFSAGEHEPLVLHCGHTYCRRCLINVSIGGNFHCPSCRKPQADLNVNSLTTNYKLLSVAAEYLQLKTEKCNEHSDELSYWCHTCHSPLCVLCIFNSHPKDHKVVKGAALLHETKRTLDTQFQQWKEDTKIRSANELQEINKNLRNWCLKESVTSKSVKAIEDLLSELSMNFGFEELDQVQAKFNSLMMVPATCNTESEPLPSSSGGEEARDQVIAAPSLEDKSKHVSTYFIQNIDGHKAEFQWLDGMLYLSAFRENYADLNLLFTMPTQVFLDLSIRGKYLGRVIIQPWYHLRRAKQFALFCLGTLGVSYVGATFKYVLKRNQPRECLVGGWYKSPYGGNPVCVDLLTELEWGGQAQGSVREGVVMAMYEDATNSSTTKSGFGICTREEKRGVFQCPFGMVVSGLDAVKRAVQHNLATEVVITNCGAVVYDLAS